MEKIILEIKDLSFSYTNQEIFKKINFNVYENKIYGIFGQSGIGKTTFLKILSLLYTEYDFFEISGEILFKGVDILKIKKDFWKIRRKIVYISQNPQCFKMSVFKNVAFPLSLLKIKDKSLVEAKVTNALKQVNLFNEVKEKLNASALELSGGQQQRLAIARALVLEPDILLFDEPTSSLDMKNSDRIGELIKKLKERHTVIFVSHDTERMKKLSDFIYEVKDKNFIPVFISR
jgi:phosphate transport system ATP-binding protein